MDVWYCLGIRGSLPQRPLLLGHCWPVPPSWLPHCIRHKIHQHTCTLRYKCVCSLGKCHMESLSQRMESMTHPQCQNLGCTFQSGKGTHHHSLKNGRGNCQKQHFKMWISQGFPTPKENWIICLSLIYEFIKRCSAQ